MAQLIKKAGPSEGQVSCASLRGAQEVRKDSLYCNAWLLALCLCEEQMQGCGFLTLNAVALLWIVRFFLSLTPWQTMVFLVVCLSLCGGGEKKRLD